MPRKLKSYVTCLGFFDLAIAAASMKNRRKKGKQASRKIDDQAALAFEKAESQRETERRKEEAARAKEREHRERAITRVEATLKNAKREHDKKVSRIETERAAIERRSEAENSR